MNTAEVFKNRTGSWTVYIGEDWAPLGARRVVRSPIACLPFLTHHIALSVATAWVGNGFGLRLEDHAR